MQADKAALWRPLQGAVLLSFKEDSKFSLGKAMRTY